MAYTPNFGLTRLHAEVAHSVSEQHYREPNKSWPLPRKLKGAAPLVVEAAGVEPASETASEGLLRV